MSSFPVYSNHVGECPADGGEGNSRYNKRLS